MLSRFLSLLKTKWKDRYLAALELGIGGKNSNDFGWSEGVEGDAKNEPREVPPSIVEVYTYDCMPEKLPKSIIFHIASNKDWKSIEND